MWRGERDEKQGVKQEAKVAMSVALCCVRGKGVGNVYCTCGEKALRRFVPLTTSCLYRESQSKAKTKAKQSKESCCITAWS